MEKKKRRSVWQRVVVGMLAFVLIICGGCKSKEKDKEPESLYFGDTAGVIGTGEKLIGEKTLMAYFPSPEIKVPNTTPDENGDYYQNTIGTQGAYFDGRYMYQTFILYCKNNDVKYQKFHQINNKNNLVVLVKYDMIKKEVVATSEPLYLGHAGDFTYNSKLGYIVVAHGAGVMSTVSYVNPETLEIVKTFTLDYSVYGIAYNDKTDQYAIGNSQSGFKVVDGDFKPVSAEYPGKKDSLAYTRQCISCDEDYVYWLFYGTGTNKLDGSSLETDAIYVYDWEGNFVSYIEFDLGLEPESINVEKGDIYVGTSAMKKAYIYRISSLKVAE